MAENRRYEIDRLSVIAVPSSSGEISTPLLLPAIYDPTYFFFRQLPVMPEIFYSIKYSGHLRAWEIYRVIRVGNVGEILHRLELIEGNDEAVFVTGGEMIGEFAESIGVSGKYRVQDFGASDDL